MFVGARLPEPIIPVDPSDLLLSALWVVRSDWNYLRIGAAPTFRSLSSALDGVEGLDAGLTGALRLPPENRERNADNHFIFRVKPSQTPQNTDVIHPKIP
uniref:Uncharacterized protein n=1 Tax=Knipowitschia caucasica TaxID=637954 RepID=A0AAV2J127_KNICA